MKDYIFLMHDDAAPGRPADEAHDWPRYITELERRERFAGGSEIGAGRCVRKSGEPAKVSRQLVGYIKVRAHSLDDAQSMLEGNPAYEAGGTVEIRELPGPD